MMKKGVLRFALLVIVLAAPTQSVQAAEEFVSGLAAHVHGLSELTIAMDSEELEIQFSSPAMDLAGFEHAAITREEIETIESLEAQLRKFETLFTFSGARCDHIETLIDLSGLMSSSGRDNDHHDSPDEHKDEAEDEHEGGHEHESHEQSGSHSEVVVNYTYRCENTANLSAISVELFEFFPGIQEIHVMWIKQENQGSAELSSGNRVIEMVSP
jgi:uncharacterized protein DUF2796